MTTPPSESDSSTRPLRVLHLYAGNLFGGVERFLVNLVKLRDFSPSIDTRIALCFEGRLADQLRAGASEPRMFSPVRMSRPWTVWRVRRQLRQLATVVPFDVAVTHSGWLHAVFAPTLKKLRMPVVFFAHNPPQRSNWLDRLAFSRAPARVIANSKFTAEAARAVFPSTPCDVVYLPQNMPERPIKSQRQKSDDFVILIAARFEQWKGHRILIRALGALPMNRQWKCLIAGAPQNRREHEYVRQLQSSVLELKLQDRVQFLGHRDDVDRLLENTDVLCQPNTEPEAFGVAFIEAMAGGVPVITSDCGAARELIEGTEAGILCPIGDWTAVANAIVRLMTDPILRDRMSAAGRNRAWEISNPQVRMAELEAALRKSVRGDAT